MPAIGLAPRCVALHARSGPLHSPRKSPKLPWPPANSSRETCSFRDPLPKRGSARPRPRSPSRPASSSASTAPARGSTHRMSVQRACAGSPSTAGGIRTRNLCVLSAAPLPGWATAACASTAVFRLRGLRVPKAGVEPATPRLSIWCLYQVGLLRRLNCWTAKSGRRESNPRSPEWRSGASPLGHGRMQLRAAGTRKSKRPGPSLGARPLRAPCLVWDEDAEVRVRAVDREAT